MKWTKQNRLNLQSPVDPKKRISFTGDLQDLIDYLSMAMKEAHRDPNTIRALRNVVYWKKVLDTVK